jgi:NDP-sugar pyrophosphorylase family protein
MLKGTRYLNIREQSLAINMMRMEAINSVPILDDSMKILDIVFIEDVYKPRIHKNTSLKDVPVIVMAGGKGTRLYPYTKILPKPLIPIGDIPILERILDHFRNYGCREFYLTVNYKKEMIRSYFNDLNPPYVIHYVEENKPLGTAGSISLIKEELSGPVIITNCDILIETDYENLLKRHIASDNAMTIVASLQDTVIPYGVIHTSEDGYIETIEEKPRLSYLINTGMYIVDARYLKLIPHDRMYHMTELAEELLRREHKVGTYPVSENSFLDMGQFEELKKMEERITGG